MATKNIPLTILPVNRPGIISPAIVFLTQTANDDLVIPFRYPFADIENHALSKRQVSSAIPPQLFPAIWVARLSQIQKENLDSNFHIQKNLFS